MTPVRSAAGAAFLLFGSLSCLSGGATPAPTPSPEYLIVDVDWAPPGSEALDGAVLSWRPGSEPVVFARDPRFRDPQFLARGPGRTLWLVDLLGDPEAPGRRGCVFRLDPDDGRVLEVVRDDRFALPVAAAFSPDGDLFVADRAACPRGPARGAVFRIDAEGRVSLFCADARLRAPSFLWFQEGSLHLLDADAKSEHGGEGVFFRLSLEDGSASRIGALRDAISPLGVLPEPEGTWIVFDANADPCGLRAPLGALWRFDPDSGRTSLLACGPPLRDPVRGVLRDHDTVWFVDANADPQRHGPDRARRGQNATGGGAVLACDRRSGRLRVVAAFATLVNPVQIVERP